MDQTDSKGLVQGGANLQLFQLGTGGILILSQKPTH